MDSPSHCPAPLPGFSEPLQSIGVPSVPPLSLPSGPSSGTTSPIAQGHREKQKNVRAQDESYGHPKTIDMVPDTVLLGIFDFFRENSRYRIVGWKWHVLAHVCRRWRQVVFESPNRLNLQIRCTHRTPVRKNLSSWPAFPIVISYYYDEGNIKPDDEDNVIAALEHPNRVCRLELYLTGPQLEEMSTVMQEPFPVLKNLWISAKGRDVPVLPSGFLGASAPCLRSINLIGIPFPALPTLLMSTSDLVHLDLQKIPPTGYIPPEAMVACLAALPCLEAFSIGFQMATPRPDRICPPPVTRSVLPALTSFGFVGASGYLEDLVSQIDGPQLNRIFIHYFNRLVDLRVAQLTRFIDRSVGPKLTLSGHARVTFPSRYVIFNVDRHANDPDRDLHTTILCRGIDWRVSHVTQVLSHFSTIFSNVVHLKLLAGLKEDRLLEDMNDAEWVHLLQQFSTVQTLCVSQELAGHVALALEDSTEMVTEVLPLLDLIYLEGQPGSSIEKFVAVRQLSGRPVTIIDTGTEFDERLKSYVSE